MPYLNQVTLMGHAGKDGEVRYTQTGKAILELTLATSSGKGDKKKTEWHNVLQWDPPEWLEVNKGDLIFATGRVTYQSWEHEGQKRQKTVIVGRVSNLSQKRKQTQDNVPF